MSFAPRLPSLLLRRERLIARFGTRPLAPLIVLRAPAGGGKTTLAADWASRYAHRGAWVALDSAIGRRLGFWSRVVTALIESEALPANSVLRELTMSEEIVDSLRAVLLRGFSMAPDRVLLVLDDYHHVSDDAVHEDLHWLLASGARLDIVVLTRTVTPYELPEWRARVDTLLLGPTALSFTRDETLAVGRVAGIDDLDSAALHEEFDGWPLAVRAAVMEMASHPGQGVPAAVARLRAMGTAELLTAAELSPYLKFLLRLSVARVVTHELAVSLAGPEAALHLERAENDGLGTWSRSGDRDEFTLQPYLRSQLLAELERRLPAELPSIRISYGRHLEHNGEPMEAIRQFAEARDWDSVTHVARVHYGSLILLHGTELSETLNAADPADLRRQPLLTALRLTFDNTRPTLTRAALLHRVSLGISVIQARLGAGPQKDRIHLLYALMGTQRLGGHYDAAVGTAERLVAGLSTLEEAGQAEVTGIRSSAWVHSATSFFYAEQPQRAEELFRVAAEVATVDDRPWGELHATSMRLLMVAMRGDHAVLAPQLAAARERSRPLGWEGKYSSAGFHLAEAFSALERFDAVGARAELARLEPHEHSIEHWALIARLRGLAALVEGDSHVGLERLAADIAAHSDRAPISRAMSSLLAVTRADLLLGDAEPHRAASALRSLRRSPATSVAQARVDLALGRNDRAISAASAVAWSQEPIPRAKAEALLLTAIAAARLNRDADARQALERGLDTLAAADLRRPLMMVPRPELLTLLASTGLAGSDLLNGVPDVLKSPDSARMLTASEIRVLDRLRETGSADELAEALFLSANTVKSHLRTIYRKLGATSREEALAAAALRGLFEESAPGD